MASNAAGAAVVICVSDASFNWLSLLSPALVLISAVIAYFALRNTRSIARQKATLDLIEKMETDSHYRTISQRFSALRKAGGFAHLNAPTEEDEADRGMVLDYLNHYEIVAIGIRENILDARIYRRWMEGIFVRDWNAATAFVQRERWKYDGAIWTYRSSIFENYQAVAMRWSRDAIGLAQSTSPPPEDASGPGDVALPRSSAEEDGDA